MDGISCENSQPTKKSTDYIQLATQKKVKTENPISATENATVEYKADKKSNEILQTELTIENLKQSLAEECGCSFEKITDKNLIKERFCLVINKMSDDEKITKSGFILDEFKSYPDIIKIFFESFKDKNKATECADSINIKAIIDLDNYNYVKAEIIKHMSVPGTQKLFNEYKEEVFEFYQHNKKLIDSIYKNDLSEEARQEIINSLSDNDKAIINKYSELVQLGVIITQSVSNNENLADEEKEELITGINCFFKEQPGYNLFLERMAKFLSDDSNELNIDKDKLSKLLDKVSDNKFSETVQKISEKSAVDNDTGMLKTASSEIIAKSEEKIQEIKQAIIETSAPKETTEEETKKEDIADTNIVDYEAITGNDGVAIIKNVFSGKIKISDYLEKTAIKQYKLMDAAIQGDMLLNASGKFFNDLVKNTKSSTLENLLAIGWKGKSHDATQKVKDEAEERKDDVA